MTQYNKDKMKKDLGAKNEEVDDIIKKLQKISDSEPEDKNLFTGKEEDKNTKKPDITR